MEKIDPKELSENLSDYQSRCLILDVREQNEYAGGHVPGAVNIPLGQLSARLGELKKDREILAVCLSGGRAAMAAGLLEKAGYKVKVLAGGMNSWKGETEK